MKKNEKYSERFFNKENEVAKGIFNSENWGKRITIMTPKEKGIELVDKFMIHNSYQSIVYYNAKQCALIAVDEIINYCCGDDVLFLHKVKQEIEKL